MPRDSLRLQVTQQVVDLSATDPAMLDSTLDPEDLEQDQNQAEDQEQQGQEDQQENNSLLEGKPVQRASIAASLKDAVAGATRRLSALVDETAATVRRASTVGHPSASEMKVDTSSSSPSRRVSKTVQDSRRTSSIDPESEKSSPRRRISTKIEEGTVHSSSITRRQSAFVVESTGSCVTRRQSALVADVNGASVAATHRQSTLGASHRHRESTLYEELPIPAHDPNLKGKYKLYTSVFLTVLISAYGSWVVCQLNLTMFHNPEDCREFPIKPKRCILFPGHTKSEWVLAVTSWTLGCAIGSLFTSYPADLFGRKATIVGNAALIVIGGVIETWSPSIQFFTFGRFLSGISSGSGGAVTSIYFADIGTGTWNSTFVILNQLAGAIGYVAIMGAHFMVNGTKITTGWIMGVPILLGMIQLICSPFLLIESPKWLLMKRGPIEAAKAYDQLYSGGNFASFEKSIKQDVEKQKKKNANQQVKFCSEVLSPSCFRQCLIAWILCVARQLGGTVAVTYYSSDIFLQSGMDDPRKGNLILSLFSLVAVMGMCKVTHILPRRRMLLIAICGMIICSLILTYALMHSSTLSIITMGMYLGLNSTGLSTLAYLVASEVLPDHLRTKGISIATCLNWCANMSVAAVFPTIVGTLGHYAFLPFTVLLTVFWFCIYFLLPETVGKTTEQIQKEFQDDNALARFLFKNKLEQDTETARNTVLQETEEMVRRRRASVELGAGSHGTLHLSGSAATAAAATASAAVVIDIPSSPRGVLSQTA